MLIHKNGPMMKLNHCWRSRKNKKRSKSPKAPTGSLKHWFCRFITAAFIRTHDIKLGIRAINKEETTLLYAMFVYNARREHWIQDNDISVFANFPIRPSTRIRIRIGLKKFPLWRAFSKISGYGRKIHWIRVDASHIRKNSFHKFPDTCGRCPRDVNKLSEKYCVLYFFFGIVVWIQAKNKAFCPYFEQTWRQKVRTLLEHGIAFVLDFRIKSKWCFHHEILVANKQTVKNWNNC